MVKDEAVAGAVHGLESELLLLDLEPEHVLGVVVPVARRLPQLRVVDIRRDDLVKKNRHARGHVRKKRIGVEK